MENEEAKIPILFITSSDHGQANVILAVAEQLLRRSKSSFAIHIASTALLAQRVSQLGHNVNFHLLPGSSMFGGYLQSGYRINDLLHRPGMRGAVSSFDNVAKMMKHWMNGQYLEKHNACREILQNLSPIVVVIDPVCAPEIDACRILRQKLIVLSPMGLKDLLIPVQPWAGVLWKYPAMSSGYLFPLPLYLVLANIYILLRLVAMCFLFSHEFREIAAVRKSAGLTGSIPSTRPYVPEKTHYLVPDLPELSLPLAVIPPNVTACGPIVSSPTTTNNTESSVQLLEWMRNGETVIVNFGSHICFEEGYCTSLARGLGIALRKYSKLRVLWKLKQQAGISLDGDITGALGPAWVEGRVKIVKWLDVSPADLLALPGVVASVHHGGANAYFETCRAGVPHVILPVWYDTYGNAACAEFLKIGIYANRNCAPGISDTEFGNALCLVLDENDVCGKEIRSTSKTLGERCQKESGREIAAGVILKIIRGEIVL